MECTKPTTPSVLYCYKSKNETTAIPQCHGSTTKTMLHNTTVSDSINRAVLSSELLVHFEPLLHLLVGVPQTDPDIQSGSAKL